MAVVEIEAEKGTPQVVARWGQPDSQGATLCTSLSDDSPSVSCIAITFVDHLLYLGNHGSAVYCSVRDCKIN